MIQKKLSPFKQRMQQLKTRKMQRPWFRALHGRKALEPDPNIIALENQIRDWKNKAVRFHQERDRLMEEFKRLNVNARQVLHMIQKKVIKKSPIKALNFFIDRIVVKKMDAKEVMLDGLALLKQ